MSDDQQEGKEDKRQFQRFALMRRMRVKVAANEADAELKDVSAGGVALKAEIEAEPDTPVELLLEDSSRLPLGRVARSFDDGFAVTFEFMEDDAFRLAAKAAAERRDDESDEK